MPSKGINRMTKNKWKLSFWLSLLIPCVVFILTIVYGQKAEPPSNMNRSEYGLAAFICAAFYGIVVSALCLPLWVRLKRKAFKKTDEAKKCTKDEHIIENISREEAVARMKERYRQDAEGKKE